MRKFYSFCLFLLVVLCTSLSLKAQVSAYAFTATSGTFTPISGGTPVATTVSATDFLGDVRTSVPLPIGFTFNYDGNNYTQVIAASDGFISFASGGTSAAANNLATTAASRRPLIAPLWDDLDGNVTGAAANYQTTGSPGSRVFTIEWLNWQWNWSATGNTISFQVKLYEGTNVIEFIYRQETGTVNSGSASIGLAGVGTGAGNFLSLNNSSASPTASSTTETTTISTKPATGQVYRFTPPSCIAPAGITITGITTTSAVANWTSPTTGTFEYVVSTTNVAPTGAGTTLTNGSTISGLLPGTSYFLFLRTDCGSGSYSAWVNTPFTTLCLPTTVPYNEGFESITAAATLPACMSATGFGTLTSTEIAAQSNNRSARTGTDYAWFRFAPGAAGQWFFTAPISVTAGTQYRFSVWYKTDGAAGFDTLRTRWGTAATVAAQSNLVAQVLNPTNTSYQELAGSFTATSTGAIVLSIQATGTSFTPWYITIDDISFAAVPSVDISVGNVVSTATGCPGSNGTVSTTITNQGAAAIDFAATPATINATATGVSTSTASITISSGTLAPGASQVVVLSPAITVNSSGSYTLSVTGSITGDANTANNTATATFNTAPIPTAVSFTPASPSSCAGGAPILLTANGGISAVVNDFSSGTIALNIPDNNLATGASSMISVTGLPAGATIDSMVVTLNMTHTFMGDMIIHLQGPNGQIINLFNARGGAGDNLANTRISSAGGATALSAGAAPFTGTFAADLANVTTTTPATTATTFSSVWGTANGNYSLRLFDGATGDVGTLTNWSIRVYYKAQGSIVWSPTTGLFTDAAGTIPYTGSSTSTVYASPSTATTYTAVATSAAGCTSGSTVTVNISPAPTVTSQPVPQAVCTGATATFTVSASGSGLSYQWRKSGVNITGANGASYIIPAVASNDTGNYDVVIIGACGSITSNAVALTINSAPVIVTQPTNQSACTGGSVTFSVNASGAGLTYQWRQGGVNIAGANSATYTIASVAASDAGTYDVVITGACAPGVTSNTVNLSLNVSPLINTQPSNIAACVGGNATFSVNASGTGLTYQWRKSGVNIAGATSASFTITPVTAGDAGNYDVIVSSPCGTPITSNAAVLSINSGTTITTQPTNQTVCSGGALTLTVAATGTNLTYQWRKAGVTITGATSATYTVNPVSSTDAGTFDVVISGDCGNVTSTPAIVTVNPSTSITTQPQSQTICGGGNATFNVVATGPGLTYQWRLNGTNIAGATNATYTINGITAANAGAYSVVIGGTCGNTTSANAVLTVNAIPTISTQPVAQGGCSGSSVNFNVTATGSLLTYQWRRNGTNITGATGATYTINNATTADNGNYDVVITNPCGTVTSTAAVLTVSGSVQITSFTGTSNICAGATANFNVAATTSGGTLTYQWRRNGVNIAGATNASYNIAQVAITDAGTYDVVVSSGGSCTVTTSPIALAVNTGGNCVTAVPTIDPDLTGAVLMPNVVESQTSLRVDVRRSMRVDFQLVDGKGKAVMQFSKQLTAGRNDFRLNLGHLANGTYYLLGFNTKGKVVSLRLVRM